jgi:ABC-2 type transport system permease protein
VAASSLMMEATVLQNPYMGNGEFLLGLLSRLTGQDLGITLAPKTLGLEYLPVSEFQMSLWGGVFTVLLPLLVMAAGVGIFLHRRHL